MLIAGPSLFMGLGAFLWIPLSLAIGRRPIILISTILLAASSFMASIVRTPQELLISICLQGLAEGVSASVVGSYCWLAKAYSND